MTRTARGWLALAFALALAVRAASAMAQDFAAPAPAGPSKSAGAFLERALPEAPAATRSGGALEMIAIAWDPAAELTTRALAGLTRWRGITWGAGVSSSGDDVVGWNSAALAIGHAGASHGAGVRALVRRDRAPQGADGARPGGLEAGAGFWSAVGSRARLWASAPMAFSAGEPPPLDRGLETGISIEAGAFTAWGVWSAPAGAVDAGERALGAGCASGVAALWAEAVDRPLRASIALRVRRGALSVCAQVNEHPALGESARVSLSIGDASP
jgi:hypothetical protein